MPHRSPKIAIYALTRQGCALGAALCEKLASSKLADLHSPTSLQLAECHPFDSLAARVAELFHAREAHVFITAAGIAVRSIAPHLKGKATDPAVVVMDQAGTHVISLLSGHLGGANELAIHLAGLVGATPVITTATDTAGLPSLDLMARNKGLAIGNLKAVKLCNSALLDGRKVQIFDPDNWLGAAHDTHFSPVADSAHWDRHQPGVWVDWRATAPGGQELRLHPRIVYAGLGCRKGVPHEAILSHLRHVLARENIAEQSLAALGTIEEKQHEPGLTQTGTALGIPLYYFTKDQLNGVTEATPSQLVKHHMGVNSVCEAAAILASKGRLITPKKKTDRVTCALAVSLS